LRRLRLIGCVVALAGLMRTSELAVIAFNPGAWVESSMPPDWQVKVNHGRAQIAACSDANGRCVRLDGVDSSFGLESGTDVDPYQLPYLTWRWKVTQLPAGGDFRHTATDDQAAQLLVAFANRHILSYIWDSTAPKGTMEQASGNPLLRIYVIVCESGPAQAGKWIPEARDVVADYQRAYGKPAPHIKGLRLQINSQHTGSVAESYFGEVAFRAKLP
jgi:Protein of unknown function (DUF3047)